MPDYQCPPLSLSLSLFLDEKLQCANIRSDRSFIVTPLGAAIVSSFRTLCAVECSEIRDCVILLMPTVIVDIAANMPSDDADR